MDINSIDFLLILQTNKIVFAYSDYKGRYNSLYQCSIKQDATRTTDS